MNTEKLIIECIGIITALLVIFIIFGCLEKGYEAIQQINQLLTIK